MGSRPCPSELLDLLPLPFRWVGLEEVGQLLERLRHRGPTVREHDRLERDLRLAIGTPDIRPHYQPLIDLKTGRLLGFEALARWRHPKFGEITPDVFIPIAEDTGMIDAIGYAVLEMACRQTVVWLANDIEREFTIG